MLCCHGPKRHDSLTLVAMLEARTLAHRAYPSTHCNPQLPRLVQLLLLDQEQFLAIGPRLSQSAQVTSATNETRSALPFGCHGAMRKAHRVMFRRTEKVLSVESDR